MTPYATNSCVHLIKSRKRVEKEGDGKRRERREEEEKGERRRDRRSDGHCNLSPPWKNNFPPLAWM